MSNSPSPISNSFRRFWIICLSLSLFFTFTSNPNRTLYFLIPDSIQPLVYVPLPRQWEHVSQVRPLLAQIPPDASVTASTYLIPHLSGRREIIRFPNLQLRNDAREVVNVDYIIADLWQMQQYQTAFREERELLQNGIPFIEQLSSSGQYGIIGFKDGVILMQKGAASVEPAIASWQAFRQQVPPK